MAERMRQQSLLIVDDDVDDQELARVALRRLQRKVAFDIVQDGLEALSFLRASMGESAPSQNLPRLALVDLSMPGMGGLEMLRQLRADPLVASLPVVVFTTSTAERDIAASYAAGCNAYVVKPYSVTELSSVLGRMVDFWLRDVRLPRLRTRHP